MLLTTLKTVLNMVCYVRNLYETNSIRIPYSLHKILQYAKKTTWEIMPMFLLPLLIRQTRCCNGICCPLFGIHTPFNSIYYKYSVYPVLWWYSDSFFYFFTCVQMSRLTKMCRVTIVSQADLRSSNSFPFKSLLVRCNIVFGDLFIHLKLHFSYCREDKAPIKGTIGYRIRVMGAGTSIGSIVNSTQPYCYYTNDTAKLLWKTL